MRAILLLLFLCVMVLESSACYSGRRGTTARFYHLFRQDDLGPKGYADFLRDVSSRKFYGDASRLKASYSRNIQLWEEFLDHEFSKETLERALKRDDRRVLEKEWEEETPKKRAAADYIRYAKICSDAFAYRRSNSWDYGDILGKEKKRSINKLIEKGYKRFEEAEYEQLKARYAYQLVRALHYIGRYQEAVEFYEKRVESEMEKDEVYYYTMDQAAGCYYSLGDHEEAAYRFLKVFGNSEDRKRSAFVSYEFCLDQGQDGRSLFEGKEDQGIHITIKALRNVHHDLDRIVQLYETDPSEERLRLLFTRAMYDLERSIWPKRVGQHRDTLPHLAHGKQKRIEKLDSIATVLRDDPSMEASGFWGLASSYLRFLKGDREEAEERLEKVEGEHYKAQRKMLERVYEVLDWARMDPDKEERLVEILDEELVGPYSEGEPNLTLQRRYPEDGHAEWEPAWKYLLLDHVGHLYYREDALAKAFLTHNPLNSIHDLDHHQLVDRLLEFFDKKEKSPFEQVLANWCSTDAKGGAPVAHLRYIKGIYYLREASPQEALAEFDKAKERLLKEGKKKDFEWWKVSGRVFSNNIKECFRCPEKKVMKDSVFIHDAYPFLNDEPMEVPKLAASLVKLDSMISNAVEWKQKLAHYLKGNFYYNVTTTGYYRGALVGKRNCCNYQHGRDPDEYQEVLSKRPGYNLYGLDAPSLYRELAKEAMNEYEKVLELSDDAELNARTLYMMAKCELNTMYSEADLDRDGLYYQGKVTDKTLPYKDSFGRLHRKYKNSSFYEEIIDRCAFFEHYVGQRF